MDIGPTLDVIDGPFEDSCEDDEEVWGRLFPLRKEFVAQSEYKIHDGFDHKRVQSLLSVEPVCVVL